MTDQKTGVVAKRSIVRPDVLITTFSGRSVQFVRHQRLNLIAAGLYLLQAVILLVVGKSASAPVRLDYLARDPLQSGAQRHDVLLLASHHLWDVSLLALLVTFLLCSAVFHVLLATVLLDRYEKALQKNLNDLRWLGYAVLGSFAAVTTALVLGVADVTLLIALVALTVLMSYGAMAVEANKKFWPWGIFGCVAVVGAMATVAGYVLGGALYGATLPVLAYGPVVATALAAAAITFNLWKQTRVVGRWHEYLFAETVYLAIGFVATTVVTWTVFAGVL